MLTLSEANKLSNDVLKVGVIEEIIKDDPLLPRLPFVDIVGNGLTYNREATLPTVQTYDVGDTWAESTPTFTQVTAQLKIIGGDADTDNFLGATRANIQDLEAVVIMLKAKAIAQEFGRLLLYGNNASEPKQFDGLRALIDLTTPGSQVVVKGASGLTLTIDHLDELIDKVKGGRPDMLLMSARSRRKINSLARAAGSNLQVERGLLGEFVQLYNGIPIGVTDHQLDTHVVATSKETGTTGGTSSVIYALRFGADALAGLQSPGGLKVERVGQLETKDAVRTRLKWYASLALFCTVSVAALIGVKD